MRLLYWLALFLFLYPGISEAEGPLSTEDVLKAELLVAPFDTHEIDPSRVFSAKAELERALRLIAPDAKTLPNPKGFRVLQQSPLKGLLLPHWCGLGPYQVVGFELLSTGKGSGQVQPEFGRLQALGFRAVKWGPESTPPLSSLLRSALETPNQAPGPNAPSVFKLALDLATPRASQNSGSGDCLALVLKETLTRQGYNLSLGPDRGYAHQLYSLYFNRLPWLKPNHHLQLDWQNLNAQNELRGTLNWALSAATLQSPPQKNPQEESFSLSWGPDGGLNLNFDRGSKAPLLEKLQLQQLSLLAMDAPLAIKKDRAWLYLDRGRAWGLEINDRLSSRTADGTPIEGHIVGFYGEGLGLRSPRGFGVAEGAILFVRKGQKKAQTGLEFHFDPKTYPSPR